MRSRPLKFVTCPRCGLALVIRREGECLTIDYDFSQWEHTCKRVTLDSPVRCLLQPAEARVSSTQET